MSLDLPATNKGILLRWWQGKQSSPCKKQGRLELFGLQSTLRQPRNLSVSDCALWTLTVGNAFYQNGSLSRCSTRCANSLDQTCCHVQSTPSQQNKWTDNLITNVAEKYRSLSERKLLTVSCLHLCLLVTTYSSGERNSENESTFPIYISPLSLLSRSTRHSRTQTECLTRKNNICVHSYICAHAQKHMHA